MTNPNRGPFAEEGTYDGKPQITLKWRLDSQYPCSLGIGKVRLILACLPQLQAFAAKHPDEGIGNRGQGRPAAPPPARVDFGNGSMVEVAPKPAPGTTSQHPGLHTDAPFDPTKPSALPPPC